MPEQFSLFQRPVSGILGAVALLLLWAFPAMAAMHLDVPARAARGDAIRVQASGDGPARPVTVFWLEREHVMAAQPSGSGWQAEFLLPVPLDSGAKSLVLKARTQDGRQAEARVILFDKKRPVQALRVDKKYVDPPAAVQERIRKDREKAGKALDNYTDAVILATGSVPLVLPIPGLADCGYVTAQDLLLGKTAAGRRALVVGGGMVGCEAAEYLAERGHQVAIVEMKDVIAADVTPENRRYMFRNFEGNHVLLQPGAKAPGNAVLATGDALEAALAI